MKLKRAGFKKYKTEDGVFTIDSGGDWGAWGGDYWIIYCNGTQVGPGFFRLKECKTFLEERSYKEQPHDHF